MANYLTVPIPVIAGFDWPREGNRQEYLRVKLEITTDRQRRAQAYPHQGSGVLTSTSWADGFIVVSIGETFKQGDLVNYLPFSEFR
jgi:molybdopterin molybdotransferase